MVKIYVLILGAILLVLVSRCNNQVLVDGIDETVQQEYETNTTIDFYACNRDADCIIVDIPCCSGSLIKESVNKKYEQEWTAVKSTEYACSEPCPGGNPSFYYDYSAYCTNDRCSFTKEFNCKEGFQHKVENGIDMCI